MFRATAPARGPDALEGRAIYLGRTRRQPSALARARRAGTALTARAFRFGLRPRFGDAAPLPRFQLPYDGPRLARHAGSVAHVDPAVRRPPARGDDRPLARRRGERGAARH